MIYFYVLKIQLFVIMMTTILSLLMVTTILSFLVKKWIWSSKSSMMNLQIDFRTLNPFMHEIVKVRFFDKLLVLNTNKCHFITLEIGNNPYMWWYNYLSEKILGLTTDNNLDFSDSIFSTCKTENQKLTAVFRVSPNINLDKFSLLINSFKPACSVIEKAWRKSMKHKKLFTFNDKSLRIKLWGASQFY